MLLLPEPSPPTSTRQRVEKLSQLIERMSMTFLSALRELATMMPVFTAMTPWRPGSNTPPPTTFSRHVTTHHIAAPDQISPVNALTAVMLAVSLLSQRYNSGWTSLTTLRILDAYRRAQSQSVTNQPRWFVILGEETETGVHDDAPGLHRRQPANQ
jgi:hypothetical protein